MGTRVQPGDNKAYAYILYSDNDIQYIGYWAYNMARQHRSSYINSSAQQIQLSSKFDTYIFMAMAIR